MSTKKWIEENQDLRRKYRRDWYHRNKLRSKEALQEYRHNKRQWLADYKATLKCLKCPESHPACLDFHHRDRSQKDAKVADIISKLGWSIERILEEIDKCDVLCANCHRKFHFEEKYGSEAY